MLIAIASKDGVSINEHFGHAKKFYVYSVMDGKCRLEDEREVRHYCLGGSSDKTALPDILETVKDCAAVFVAKIGDGPAGKLQAKGIQAVDRYSWEEIPASLRDYERTVSEFEK